MPMNPDSIAACTAQVTWYIKYHDKADPKLLMDCQDKLAGYSFFLAEEAAIAKLAYNQHYFSRKIAISKAVSEMTKNKMAVSKAEHEAIAGNEDAYRVEQQGEAYSLRCDLLLKQVNKILSALQQRLGFARMEAGHQKFSPKTQS